MKMIESLICMLFICNCIYIPIDTEATITAQSCSQADVQQIVNIILGG